jgi:hypothetical protein
MRVNKNKLYAVVTGDVIASSRLSDVHRRDLHQAMTATSRALRKAFKSSVPAEVDVFRGDSWQMVLTTPASALRIALYYRAGLRSRMESHQIDMRMALAIGKIDFIPDNRVSQGDGEAFQLSGKALESMSKSVSMRFRLPGRAEERALDVVVQLVDSLAARWSDKQARAVTGALQGWKQDKIAKTCWQEPISQQAVAQHLDRAAWSSVEIGLTFFEETVQSILAKIQAE